MRRGEGLEGEERGKEEGDPPPPPLESLAIFLLLRLFGILIDVCAFVPSLFERVL